MQNALLHEIGEGGGSPSAPTPPRSSRHPQSEDDGRDPADDGKHCKEQHKAQRRDERVCDQDQPEDDAQDTEDNCPPALAGEPLHQVDCPDDKTLHPDDDGVDRRDEDGAVEGIGEHEDTREDTEDADQHLPAPSGFVSGEADEHDDTIEQPVDAEDSDKERWPQYYISD